MLVETLAKKNLVTARPDETVRDAVHRMVEERVGAVLVVEDGYLRGIFSERDALKRVLGDGLDPDATTVAEVYTSDPVTVSRDATISECARHAKRHRIRHIPVVDNGGRPIGIVSVRDFLRLVVTELEELIERVHHEHRIQELTDPYSLIDE